MARELVPMPTGEPYQIVKDRYQKERGEARMLEIRCSSCGETVILYQKDGPGPLLRCYVDRVAWPPEIAHLEGISARSLPNLECGSCHTVIGSPMVYKPEDRPAFNMRPGFFSQAPYKPDINISIPDEAA